MTEDIDWPEYFRNLREQFDAAHETHDDEPAFEITVAGHEISPQNLPSAAKKVVVWVQANKGWLVKAQHSQTHHQPELFAADSKASGARKGDVKTPERDKEHWGVRGVLQNNGQKIADFEANWDTVNGKNLFLDASHWDSVTGERYLETQTGPFEAWLRILAPTGAPKPRPPRKTKADVDEAINLLEMETWQA